MTNMTNRIYDALAARSDEEKKIILPRFFKTGKGQYGEGDKFLGVTVPNIRTVANEFKDTDFEIIEELMHSPWHEMRMCALLILVNNSKKEVTKETFDFYLSQTKYINNWDLVDLTAPQIIGKYLINKDRDILYKLAESDLLWDNRIAIVSTLAFIRNNDLDDTYKLSIKMMYHKHDLMHKAIGWMLREAGKRDTGRLYNFVKEHKNIMPRTMLRYSIEKFDKETRKELMS
ncbi:MAG: DNA alkylation repair protein [Paludibacteraceae bacterium]|nr:DNA alkylation repair protein [Bacteroidales bacterium]MBO5829490.1 DNA alkylation repair protein [Paludibacteraceae bacterium]MBO5853949.1 DNA alkylation repair protein [Bacteroidales bacterium]